MKARYVNGLVLCLGLYFALYGCAALVAGGAAAGATYVYKEGWVQRDYRVGLDKAYNASVQAAEDLKLNIGERNKQLASADIKAQKGDEDYWIRLEQKDQNLTTVSVRTGVMGDKLASQMVHDAIQKKLGGS